MHVSTPLQQAELAYNLGHVKIKQQEKRRTREHFSRIRLSTSFVRKGNRERSDDARFPWIHKSDPVDFHFSKRLPRKNQFVVPWC